jgi:hypothetical protein
VVIAILEGTFEEYIALRQSWVWWWVLIIPAFLRLREEDHEVKDSLSYLVR